MTTPSLPTPRPRSNAELLLAVQLEQAGIPFEREYRFAPPRRWRADFAVSRPDWALYDEAVGIPVRYALLVEIDGGTWVSGRHNRGSSIAKDFEKGAAAAIAGYRVIHATTKQVEQGICLAWIKAALGLEESTRDAA